MGRQHRGMDRPGVRQVPEGSGEQEKMEKTGCKIICGAPTTLAVNGLMMMIMIFDALVTLASSQWRQEGGLSRSMFLQPGFSGLGGNLCIRGRNEESFLPKVPTFLP